MALKASSYRSSASAASSRALSPAAGRDLVALALLLLLALVLRLPNLDVYTLSLPEGIRLEQLALLSAGYQACADVFCNQGPLALQAMHPTFVLFGGTLAAARSSALIASLVGLAATYELARRLWDRPTGLVAGLLLAISPTYLKFSRLALPEMVALAPTLLALVAAVRYRQGGRLGWLLAAGALFGLSLLIKPVAAPAIVPLALLAAAAPNAGRRALLLGGGAMLAVVLLGVLLVGPSSIGEQVVFRWQSRLAEGRGPDWNWAKIVDELSHDRVGIFGLAAVGALLLARRERPTLAVVGGWTTANLALLLWHTPLHDKHILIVLPPVALLAGYAVTWTVRRLAGLRPGTAPPPTVLLALAAAGLVLYLGTLPGVVERNGVLVEGSEMIEPDPAQHWYADASAAFAAVTRPGSFVVTDFPYVAFGASRLVPPQLVEASLTRIRAGSLTDEIAIEETARFEPDAILLWWDRLARLERYKDWLDNRFRVVRVYAADREAVQTLYLPRGTDLAPLQARLDHGATVASGARFENGLLLERWGLDDPVAAPGEQRSLTVLWRSTRPLRRDVVAVLTLRSPERPVWTSQRLPLLGNGDGAREWAPGRWIVWSGLIGVPRKLEPGSYLLSIRIGYGREGDFVAVDDPGQTRRLPTADPKGLELGVLEVRGEQPTR